MNANNASLPNTASGNSSHAEGYGTTASGTGAHAEGLNTLSTANASHAEGVNNNATGQAAHVEGQNNVAQGVFSHAEGFQNIATNIGSHIMGIYGETTDNYSWHVGNGTSASNRGLAALLQGSTGDLFIDGTLHENGADYAEMFETIDGNSITPGRFISLQGKKVKVATSADSYILGITSAASAIKGNAAELHWHHKYLKDQWGRTQYEQIPSDPNDEYLAKLTRVAPKINPAYDSQQSYIPRSKRKEWVTVGLLGQLLVTDDGSCSINGYCLPNDEGIATYSETGYRVMDRISSDQILVMFK